MINKTIDKRRKNIKDNKQLNQKELKEVVGGVGWMQIERREEIEQMIWGKKLNNDKYLDDPKKRRVPNKGIH